MIDEWKERAERAEEKLLRISQYLFDLDVELFNKERNSNEPKDIQKVVDDLTNILSVVKPPQMPSLY